jgi:glycerate 2-kinase
LSRREANPYRESLPRPAGLAAFNEVRGDSVANTTPVAPRDTLAMLFRAALAAVDPQRLVANHLTREGSEVAVRAGGGSAAVWRSPTLIVGAGKAAARMASACEEILGVENVRGHVVVADGCGVKTQSITVAEAGHPLPDERGVRATRGIVQLVKAPTAGAILCLISGGASSLLVQPRPPLRLDDKLRTTQLLLDCGADINELNCVRKHLSTVKGGGLARVAACRLASLIISDVVGDDPGTVGSGPTAPDATTFVEAWGVLERYDLIKRLPAAVVELLRDGMHNRIAETVKPDSPEARRYCNVIIGSNRTALDAAAQAARSGGWDVVIEAQPLTGDTTAAAQRFGAKLRELAQMGKPLCLLAGGETTVRVRGRGRGGRNQEFALALAREVADAPLAVLSAGTDGVDGPTDAAGAFVDGTTLQRARARGLDGEVALAHNDSYPFFAQLGDLFQCGPTGTNVMDLKIALLAA